MHMSLEQVNWDDLGSTKIDNNFHKYTYYELMLHQSPYMKRKYLVWHQKFPARIIPDEVSGCTIN
jgi:hypothetical protein